MKLIHSMALMALLLSAMPFTFQMGRRAWDTAGTLDRTAAADVVARYLRERIDRLVAGLKASRAAKPDNAAPMWQVET